MKKIKEYWDKRAEEYFDDPAATTNDIYLRELEIKTLAELINHELKLSGSTILDVGCGNGYSTLKLAGVCSCFFTGIDFSTRMIESANRQLEKETGLKEKVKFRVADILKISDYLNNKYDLIISDRCLINLSTFEEQEYAFSQVSELLKPGSHFIAIENFIEGNQNLNNARKKLGLNEIQVRWHNLYFKEKDFITLADKYFKSCRFIDFSSAYYFATRVIYAGMCKLKNEEPDYSHEIHQLAVDLPYTGQFSPIRLAVLQK